MKAIRKHIIIIGFIINIWNGIVLATPWENRYGTFADDYGRFIDKAFTGGYLIGGFTRFSAGHWDPFFMRTDANGNVIWENNYGDPNYREIINSAIQTPDHGLVVIGEIWGTGAEDFPQGYMAKESDAGDQLWQYISETMYKSFSYGLYINETFVLTGWIDDNGFWKVYWGKLPENGRNGPGQPTEEHYYKYPGSFHCEGYSISQWSNIGYHGYIMTGLARFEEYGYSNSDLIIIKTDDHGLNTIYQKCGGNYDDVGYSVQQTNDGGFIVVGGTHSYGAGGEDVYVIKTDFDLNVQWTKTFGGIKDDVGYRVKQTTDGRYIICGGSESNESSGFDFYLIKIDNNGDKVYEKKYSSPETDDFSYSIQQTDDNGYIVVGSTRYKGLSFMGDQVYCLYRENIPPSNLYFGPVVYTGVKLYWTDNTSDEDGFEIDRKIGSGSWSTIGSTSANITTYLDNDVIPYYGQQMFYRVRTISEGNFSDPSNEVSLIPPGIFTDINNAINNSHGSRQLYKDNSGKFHLTFLSDNKLWYTKSTNNGQTWQVADMISSNNPCAPSIGVTTTGLPCLIWEEVGGNNHDLVYVYLDETGVYHYTTLVDNAQISLEPVMAINGNNQIAVAYVSDNTANGIITYFTFAYSNPQYTPSVFTNCEIPSNLRIVYDPSNNAHLVWSEYYAKWSQGYNPPFMFQAGRILWAKFNTAKTVVDEGWNAGTSKYKVYGPDIAAVSSTTLEFAYTVNRYYPENFRWIYYRKKTGNNWTPRLNVTQDSRIGNNAYIPRVMRNQNTVLCSNTTKIFANYTNDPQNGRELVSGINTYYDGILASSVFPQSAALVYTSGANPILINFAIKNIKGDPNKEDIQENESQFSGRFYFMDISPNPAKGEIRLRINSPDTRYMTVKLYDVLGREVNTMFNGNARSGVNEIVLAGSNLANGIYLVKLQTDEKTEIRKIVFQR